MLIHVVYQNLFYYFHCKQKFIKNYQFIYVLNFFNNKGHFRKYGCMYKIVFVRKILLKYVTGNVCYVIMTALGDILLDLEVLHGMIVLLLVHRIADVILSNLTGKKLCFLIFNIIVI